MKKIIVFVLVFIFLFSFSGCGNIQNKGNDISQTPTDTTNPITEQPIDSNPIDDSTSTEKLTNEDEILRIALEHCKTNYDYTEIMFYEDREVWEVGFWENKAKIAAQTITIDKEGNVVNVWWAE